MIDTLEDLRMIIPAAFADCPAPDVSSRYEFIPSEPIITTLLEKGWTIRSAWQNSKHSDEFAQHRVVFDVPGATKGKYAVGDVHPTATLYNSHNRKMRLLFTIGFFRTVCYNQAQVSVLSHDFSRIHILGWQGVAFNEVVEQTLVEMAPLPQLFERMRDRQLTGPERTLFGKQALSVKRYEKPDFSELYTASDSSQILAPRRELDSSMDLWTTYNVAQENIIGGQRGTGLREVGRNRNVNLALWSLAQAWLNN